MNSEPIDLLQVTVEPAANHFPINSHPSDVSEDSVYRVLPVLVDIVFVARAMSAH